ncbi:hypothetical protein ACEWY4_003571 [Coilia grayii]|uniref:Uncharacterized protein n=1 Tax=Coilia grayii TaxID=363190 RepID=A0ABD1KRM7_9TELE
MDPDERPFARMGRTFWAAWAYITTSVVRLLRPETNAAPSTDIHPGREEEDVTRETARMKGEEELPETTTSSPVTDAHGHLPTVPWEKCDVVAGRHGEESNVYSVQYSKVSKAGRELAGEEQEAKQDIGAEDDDDDHGEKRQVHSCTIDKGPDSEAMKITISLEEQASRQWSTVGALHDTVDETLKIKTKHLVMNDDCAAGIAKTEGGSEICGSEETHNVARSPKYSQEEEMMEQEVDGRGDKDAPGRSSADPDAERVKAELSMNLTEQQATASHASLTNQEVPVPHEPYPSEPSAHGPLSVITCTQHKEEVHPSAQRLEEPAAASLDECADEEGKRQEADDENDAQASVVSLSSAELVDRRPNLRDQQELTVDLSIGPNTVWYDREEEEEDATGPPGSEKHEGEVKDGATASENEGRVRELQGGEERLVERSSEHSADDKGLFKKTDESEEELDDENDQTKAEMSEGRITEVDDEIAENTEMIKQELVYENDQTKLEEEPSHGHFIDDHLSEHSDCKEVTDLEVEAKTEQVSVHEDDTKEAKHLCEETQVLELEAITEQESVHEDDAEKGNDDKHLCEETQLLETEEVTDQQSVHGDNIDEPVKDKHLCDETEGWRRELETEEESVCAEDKLKPAKHTHLCEETKDWKGHLKVEEREDTVPIKLLSQGTAESAEDEDVCEEAKDSSEENYEGEREERTVEMLQDAAMAGECVTARETTQTFSDMFAEDLLMAGPCTQEMSKNAQETMDVVSEVTDIAKDHAEEEQRGRKAEQSTEEVEGEGGEFDHSKPDSLLTVEVEGEGGEFDHSKPDSLLTVEVEGEAGAEFDHLRPAEESEDEGVSIDHDDSEVQDAHEGWHPKSDSDEEEETDFMEDFTSPVTEGAGDYTSPVMQDAGDFIPPVTEAVGDFTSPVREDAGVSPVMEAVGEFTSPGTEAAGVLLDDGEMEEVASTETGTDASLQRETAGTDFTKDFTSPVTEAAGDFTSPVTEAAGLSLDDGEMEEIKSTETGADASLQKETIGTTTTEEDLNFSSKAKGTQSYAESDPSPDICNDTATGIMANSEYKKKFSLSSNAQDTQLDSQSDTLRESWMESPVVMSKSVPDSKSKPSQQEEAEHEIKRQISKESQPSHEGCGSEIKGLAKVVLTHSKDEDELVDLESELTSNRGKGSDLCDAMMGHSKSVVDPEVELLEVMEEQAKEPEKEMIEVITTADLNMAIETEARELSQSDFDHTARISQQDVLLEHDRSLVERVEADSDLAEETYRTGGAAGEGGNGTVSSSVERVMVIKNDPELDSHSSETNIMAESVHLVQKRQEIMPGEDTPAAPQTQSDAIVQSVRSDEEILTPDTQTLGSNREIPTTDTHTLKSDQQLVAPDTHTLESDRQLVTSDKNTQEPDHRIFTPEIHILESDQQIFTTHINTKWSYQQILTPMAEVREGQQTMASPEEQKTESGSTVEPQPEKNVLSECKRDSEEEIPEDHSEAHTKGIMGTENNEDEELKADGTKMMCEPAEGPREILKDEVENESESVMDSCAETDLERAREERDRTPATWQDSMEEDEGLWEAEDEEEDTGETDVQHMATMEVESREATDTASRSALKRKFESVVQEEEALEDEPDITKPLKNTPEEDFRLQVFSLDFSIQKSRIAVKNPLVRPPTDPRALLNLPSLEPTPRPTPEPQCAPGHREQESPQSHPHKKPLAFGVPMGGVGVMGVKLPGLGAGFPVLRKTHQETKEEEKAESSLPQKSKTEQSQTEGTTEEAHQTQSKPKWTPPKHAIGYGHTPVLFVSVFPGASFSGHLCIGGTQRCN